jgi:hypothetical protein
MFVLKTKYEIVRDHERNFMQGLFWQEFFVFVLNAEEFGEGCLAGLVHILLELLAKLVAAVRAGVHA